MASKVLAAGKYLGFHPAYIGPVTAGPSQKTLMIVDRDFWDQTTGNPPPNDHLPAPAGLGEIDKWNDIGISWIREGLGWNGLEKAPDAGDIGDDTIFNSPNQIYGTTANPTGWRTAGPTVGSPYSRHNYTFPSWPNGHPFTKMHNQWLNLDPANHNVVMGLLYPTPNFYIRGVSDPGGPDDPAHRYGPPRQFVWFRMLWYTYARWLNNANGGGTVPIFNLEVWNEPDGTYWTGGDGQSFAKAKGSISEYGKMLKAAWSGLHDYIDSPLYTTEGGTAAKHDRYKIWTSFTGQGKPDQLAGSTPRSAWAYFRGLYGEQRDGQSPSTTRTGPDNAELDTADGVDYSDFFDVACYHPYGERLVSVDADGSSAWSWANMRRIGHTIQVHAKAKSQSPKPIAATECGAAFSAIAQNLHNGGNPLKPPFSNPISASDGTTQTTNPAGKKKWEQDQYDHWRTCVQTFVSGTRVYDSGLIKTDFFTVDGRQNVNKGFGQPMDGKTPAGSPAEHMPPRLALMWQEWRAMGNWDPNKNGGLFVLNHPNSLGWVQFDWDPTADDGGASKEHTLQKQAHAFLLTLEPSKDTTAPPKPANPPTIFATGSKTTTSIQLKWGAVIDDGGAQPAVGTALYRIQHSTDGGANWQPSNIPDVDASTLNVNYTGLAPGTTYVFRYKAIDANGNGTGPEGHFSDASTPLTTFAVDNVAPDATATVISNPAHPSTSLTVLWNTIVDKAQPAAEKASGTAFYTVQIRTAAGPGPFGGDLFVVQPFATTVQAVFTGLTPNTGYQFRLWAADNVGNSGDPSGSTPSVSPISPTFTTDASASTDNQAPDIPQAPALLAKTGSTMTLRWTRCVDHAPAGVTPLGTQGYTLQRATAPAGPFGNDLVISEPSGTFNVDTMVTGLAPSQDFYWRATSTDGVNTSAFSPIGGPYTTNGADSDITPPPIPSPITLASPATSSSLTVTWPLVTDIAPMGVPPAGTGRYDIKWRKQGDSTFTTVSVGHPTNQLTVMSLDNATAYEFIVSAVDKATPENASDFSDPPAVFTTTNNPPNPPTAIVDDPSPFVGQTVTFSLDTTDPDPLDTITAWEWQRVSGTAGFDPMSTKTSQVTSFAIPAGSENKTVTYNGRAFDNHGAPSTFGTTAALTVATNHPPDKPVVTVSDDSPSPGDTVTLTATTTDPDGDSFTQLWDLDDVATTLAVPLDDPTLATAHLTVPLDAPDLAVIAYRNQATDVHGDSSVYSDDVFMVVNNPPPPPPTPQPTPAPPSGPGGAIAAYRFLVADLVTGVVRDELPLGDVKYSRILNRPGGFSATIARNSRKATRANLDPMRTAIYVERNGVIVWGGILGSTRFQSSSPLRDIASQGFWSYWRKRIIRTDQFFDPVVPALPGQLAHDILVWSATEAGGDIGVVFEAPTNLSTETVPQDIRRSESRFVADTIEQLAEGKGGFDFYIDIIWQGNEIVRTWRATQRKGVRQLEAILDVASPAVSELNYEFDGSQIANALDVAGAGSGDTLALEVVQDPNVLAAYPLYDDTLTFKEISDPATLRGLGESRLRQTRVPITLPDLKIRPTSTIGVGSFDVGDEVRPIIKDGYLDFSGLCRVMSYEVSVGNEGEEEITVTLAPSEVV